MTEDEIISEMIVDDFTPITHAIEQAKEAGETPEE